MDMIQIIRFSYKNAFRRKNVAFLAIVGVTVAISLQVSLSVVSDGIDNSFNSVVNEAVGNVQITEADTILTQSQVSQSVIDVIQDSSYYLEINQILPSVILPSTLMFSYFIDGTFQANSGNNGNSGIDLSITGIDLASYIEVNTELDELHEGSEYFQEDLEIIVSNSLFDLDSSIFNIGNTIDLTINSTSTIAVTITGITEDNNDVQLKRPSRGESFNIWMSIESSSYIKSLILENEEISAGSARFLHYESQGINSTDFSSQAVNYISLDTSFTDFESVDNFMIEIEAYLNSIFANSYEVYSEATFLSNLASSQSSVTVFLDAIGIIALLTGIISIVISQMVGIESRIREFAVMKAVGWKNIHLTLEVIFESTILGVIGSVVGYFSSRVFILYLNQILTGRLGQSTSSVEFSFAIYLEALYLALFIGIVGGLYPSFIARRVDPIVALNRG